MKRFAIALALALITVRAQAASDAEELKRAGYLGHWSTDCSQRASSSNWHILIEPRSDGSVFSRSFSGGMYYDEQKEEFVRKLGRDRIQIQVRSLDMRLETVDEGTVTVVTEAARMRTLQSISKREGELVRDGKQLSDGKPTPWIYRCRSGTAY
jgi:hypothetical protein